jgi:sulfide:quinone oxidoreductase
MTPGLMGEGWRRDAFDFYTLEGALALRDRLAGFDAGRLVVNIVELPIKCPVAPLEFLFLADEFFRRRGVRDRVELVLVTPLDGAFTKPIASRTLGYLLERKGIRVETEFSTGEVDGARRVLRSYDERQVPYDLLVSIPTHSGAEFVEHSGLGNELAFVPTDAHTLAARKLDNVFVLGDATDVPTSKAGSVAHFQGHVLAENIQRAIEGRELVNAFDGHANCFVETGFGKALLIDFNYEVEPLPGRYPLAYAGPFSLLRESRINHWGKRAFRWLYWHMLLPALPIPVPSRMTMAGKRQPPQLRAA